MSSGPSTGLPRTEDALMRLAAALDRLGAAAEGASSASDSVALGELARMRDEYARLDATNRQVTERLDAALVRLRGLLGE